jgi:class 3 adenylate cyclase
MNIDPNHLPLVRDFQSRHRAGLMTLVFTDLAGSTKLKNDLGDSLAGAILSKHHSCVRELLKAFPEAREISTAGDSFFLVFDSPSNAVLFSVQLHKRLRQLSEQVGHSIRDRVGIHVGEVFVEHGKVEGKVQNFSGIQVDTCARVMSLCDPERTLMTRFAFDNAQQTLKGRADAAGRLVWISHGLFEVKGVAQPLEICEVAELAKNQPKPLEDSEKAKRFLGAPATLGAESALDRVEGWKGVVGRRRREVLFSTTAAWIGVLIVIVTAISRFDGISYDFAQCSPKISTEP